MGHGDPYLEKALRVSAAVSVAVCFVGVVIVAATASSQYDAAMPAKELLVGLKSFNPLRVVAFGVMLTIASPFAWVAAAIVSFVTTKKAFFSFLSILVLLLMLLSVVVTFR